MADIKLSQLGQITTLEDDDIILVSQDSGGGLFISKRISVSDLTTEIGGGGGGGSDVPTGAVLIWTTITAPLGFLECNGAAVSRTGFPTLFALINVSYGAGNGSTTFNVPDYRGEFLRGWAHGSSNDPDKASRTNRGDGQTGDIIGTKQGTKLLAHNHFVREYSGHEGNISFSHINSNTNGDTGDRTGSTGGSESRPRNVNVMYIIKT